MITICYLLPLHDIFTNNVKTFVLKAKNWVMIPGKDGNDPLYFCKTTGQVYEEDGSLSSEFPQEESDSDDSIQKGSYEDFLRKFSIPETESDSDESDDGPEGIPETESDSDESDDGPEGTFGQYLRQFFIPNFKQKPQSWTELATLYASKQLSGSWESDSEEETESKESQQITKSMQSKNSNSRCNLVK
jgi:hypothetical protein